jgi:transposase
MAGSHLFFHDYSLCGSRSYMSSPTVSYTIEETALTTIHFLIHLLRIYSQPIFLLLDRAPWHYGEVTSFIEEVDRLHIIRFPVACPELNPQEHVWAQARD